jgi:hypothetical protein
MWALQRALRRLLELPRRERGVLLEASVLVPLVHALQSVLPFRRWRQLLTPRRVWRRKAARSAGPTPDEIAQAVERARRGVPGVYRCLPAAYAAHLLLQRHGYDSRVEVGVARDAQGRIEAHAWTVFEERILIGDLPDLARFVPLPPLRT